LEDVTKRRTYEFVVAKRPYFHVKPLDESMLANWRKFLDMEERESNTTNPDRVAKLFERCLIAACYYSEFWLRYIKWLETHRGVEAARSAFVRATTIFLLRRYPFHSPSPLLLPFFLPNKLTLQP
jgi:pre-mRNA-processing factor 39